MNFFLISANDRESRKNTIGHQTVSKNRIVDFIISNTENNKCLPI